MNKSPAARFRERYELLVGAEIEFLLVDGAAANLLGSPVLLSTWILLIRGGTKTLRKLSALLGRSDWAEISDERKVETVADRSSIELERQPGWRHPYLRGAIFWATCPAEEPTSSCFRFQM